ncbi:MAG: CBS domain-containing protein [Gammaproteobacteria bacterium]|nr:CBS domain-containing protein [Gammaproteobacteria bacterium]
MRSQTAIFSKLVRDFMRDCPPAVLSGTTCAEAIQQMFGDHTSSVVVVDANGRLLGILTEQDVTRRIAFQIPPETPVEQVMTRRVLTIPAGEYLYHAIGRMRRYNLRHLPVLDENRAVIGILDLYDALSAASAQMVQQIDLITHEGTLDGLKQVKTAQVELAAELLDDGLPAPEIQALLTHINNDIYRRVTDMCIASLTAEGWGQPPTDFSIIVMGSGGRGENFIGPDQDNGFIVADYPDEEHNRIDGYFMELASRLVTTLDTVGLPLCRGYCMATNPIWRKTLSQWFRQLDNWGDKRNRIALRLSDIFFDFQPVWGHHIELARRLRSHITTMLREDRAFLRAMYDETSDHNVGLGLFGGFVTEKENPYYRGQINLKHHALLPLVEAVRLLSLREGVEETGTLVRIDALQDLGILNANECEDLKGAFIQITNLLLGQQIADFRIGRKITYFVHPDNLSRRVKERLIDAMKAIDRLRDRVRAELTGNLA